MKDICNDLSKEYEELDVIVADLDETGWNVMTPAKGWTVKDQIRHLAYYDERARLAVTEPEAFDQHLADIARAPEGHRETLEKVGKELSTAEVLDWWRQERQAVLDALLPLDRKARLRWYGPPMSAMSFATARIMETWAHGQDVADALGIKRVLTDRLRHIAHMGVATFGWSFTNRRMKVPDSPVRVEITSPSGELWTWGSEKADDIVKGSAEDFCLVVVQRRNPADTRLVIKGATARQWMSIAQTYAGLPGAGRKPGEFSKSTRD
ncbi:MAG: TIGR03084 family protein [Desulfobacterales bacterium]|nr:MAG: TIGR03084 family protein [Desulfobacterales bacterium]